MILLPLAMHMANELLSIPAAAGTIVLAAAAVAWSAFRAKKTMQSENSHEKLPLMGVMGAFVFAAQMINFTLPGLGTSGHLGGGVLLAILLGPWAAILTMAAILIVQCLLFQDGGLLALGCNIINMGLIPCLMGWGLYRVILGPVQTAKAWRQYLAAWAACLVAVTIGAAMVPVEALGGPLKIPTDEFLTVMVGLHLIIGFFEGLITFAVLAYLRKARPAALGLEEQEAGARRHRLHPAALAASILVTAMLIAGVVSHFASEHPDGLDWSVANLSARHNLSQEVSAGSPAAAANQLQEKIAPMPEYKWQYGWISLAGLTGTAVTLAVVLIVSRLLRRKGVKA